MDYEFLLDYRVSDSFAEIFWDLPLDADPSCSYVLLKDGVEIGHSSHTHYSLENLEPDKEYDIEVRILYPETSSVDGCYKSLGLTKVKT